MEQVAWAARWDSRPYRIVFVRIVVDAIRFLHPPDEAGNRIIRVHSRFKLPEQRIIQFVAWSGDEPFPY
jgi:hypothetical protein